IEYVTEVDEPSCQVRQPVIALPVAALPYLDTFPNGPESFFGLHEGAESAAKVVETHSEGGKKLVWSVLGKLSAAANGYESSLQCLGMSAEPTEPVTQTVISPADVSS